MAPESFFSGLLVKQTRLRSNYSLKCGIGASGHPNDKGQFVAATAERRGVNVATRSWFFRYANRKARAIARMS
jgi:hypothetical protein